MRVMVVGASSGLGRCVGVGLAQRGRSVALLARRKDRLDTAVDEAGENAVAIECDVTDAESCAAAVGQSVAALGGLDALVFTPGIGPLVDLADMDASTWRRVLDTNVVGASLVTAAALPHLKDSGGAAIYFSSVSASQTPPWPGLGAYVVSKAALDKLVDAWRAEHPSVGFTRLAVGECAGGEGDSSTGFAAEWDPGRAAELVPEWIQRGFMTGELMDVDKLVALVDMLVGTGAGLSLPTVTVTPRARADSKETEQ